MPTYQTYIVECPDCKTENNLTICTTWNTAFGKFVPPKNFCKKCKKLLDYNECKIIKNKYPIRNYNINLEK